ncbi:MULTISPECIES: TetR family transcriptional regulator [unclassified Streptomyces]|uniref:TetR family transcriptional regulator n=1 Tax=unclassified Streptomyces TaxID=2593676 RepID=UPI00381C41CC
MRAAAEELDENGYDGASITRICRRADISMGALTYHFPTKDALVEAVQDRGRSATQSMVDRIESEPSQPLRAAIDLTIAITDLLSKDAAVRATARLSQERPHTAPTWTSLWAGALRRLLDKTSHDELRPGTDPEAVAVLATHLVVGAESHIRHARATPDAAQAGAAQQLAEIWQLVLSGFAAERG